MVLQKVIKGCIEPSKSQTLGPNRLNYEISSMIFDAREIFFKIT